MSDIIWQECRRCKGKGEKEAPDTSIFEGMLTCCHCGGHGRYPTGDGAQTFYRSNGQGLQHIAVLHRSYVDESQWRVTVFCQDGPWTHTVMSADRVMDRLEKFRKCDTAAKLLDHWATRPRWSKGVKRMTLTAYINALPRELTDKIYDKMEGDATLDDVIEYAETLRKEHDPDMRIDEVMI